MALKPFCNEANGGFEERKRISDQDKLKEFFQTEKSVICVFRDSPKVESRSLNVLFFDEVVFSNSF